MTAAEYQVIRSMKTEAQKNAQKKYQNKVRATTKAQLNCTIDREEFDFINDLAKSMNISKAALIVNSLHYIADNSIDIKPKGKTETE